MIKLLICDDQSLFREALRTLLSSYPDLSVIGEAANGEEALRMVVSTSPDIVLMDLRMPAMDGFYATKIIKSLRPDLPVIAQTAYFASDNKNLVEEAGFDEYIRKPYTEEELLEKIRPFLK